jgi:uncharacterized protein (TIGR03067 family)
MHSILLLPVLSLALAPAPFLRPSKTPADDMKQMQGEWACASYIIEGKPRDVVARPLTITIRGNLMSFGSPTDTWRVNLKWLGHVRCMDLDRAGRTAGTDLSLGIYRLKGDTLTICWRDLSKDKARPLSFNPAQPGVWVSVWKRKGP